MISKDLKDLADSLINSPEIRKKATGMELLALECFVRVVKSLFRLVEFRDQLEGQLFREEFLAQQDWRTLAQIYRMVRDSEADKLRFLEILRRIIDVRDIEYRLEEILREEKLQAALPADTSSSPELTEEELAMLQTVRLEPVN